MGSLKKNILWIVVLFVVSLSCFLFGLILKNHRIAVHNIPIDYGIYFDKNWDDPVGAYKKPVIPNQETAVNVAVQIFNGMEKGSEASSLKPIAVFYDNCDEVWIVTFGKDTTDYVGFCCSIAIKKADGKVLRIWFGE